MSYSTEYSSYSKAQYYPELVQDLSSVWYIKSVILPICLDLFLFLIYQTSLIPLTKNVSAFTFQLPWLHAPFLTFILMDKSSFFPNLLETCLFPLVPNGISNHILIRLSPRQLLQWHNE